MKSLRYLNTMLTVLAVLLAVQIWTTWTGGPSEVLSWTAPAQAGGIPDAGSQRKQMVDELRQISGKLDTLTDLFRSGKARVRLEGAAPDKKN